MAFSLYTDAYGVANMIGHFLKIISFYLVYKALIETTFFSPYDLLFHRLKQREEDLTRQALEVTQVNARLANQMADLEKEITERKRLEKDLQVKDQAIESAFTGIGITDLEGKLTYANRALLQMGGYEDAEVIGKHAAVFFEDEKEEEGTLKAVLEKGSWQGELKAKKKDDSPFYVMAWADQDYFILNLKRGAFYKERRACPFSLWQLFKF